jgi:hypothetical protein
LPISPAPLSGGTRGAWPQAADRARDQGQGIKPVSPPSETLSILIIEPPLISEQTTLIPGPGADIMKSLGRLFWIAIAVLVVFAAYKEFGPSNEAFDSTPHPHVTTGDLR